MNMSNINNFIKVKNDIFEQQMYPQRKQRYIVGEMKCFADTSLKRSEFFIANKLISLTKFLNKINHTNNMKLDLIG